MVEPAERARRAVALRDAGVRAMKLRFGLGDWRTDVEAVAQVRDAVGTGMEIMVDANQGWRMPGDLRPRWDVAEAAQCARALEPLGVYWLEEPLATDDYRRICRASPPHRSADRGRARWCGSAAEARDLVVRGGVDVIQTDVMLAGGIGGCRQVVGACRPHRRAWSPHTWSNGYGLVVNLHAALAFSAGPYVEVPFDPPEWSAAARDWLLPGPGRDRPRRHHRAACRAGPRDRAGLRSSGAVAGRLIVESAGCGLSGRLYSA